MKFIHTADNHLDMPLGYLPPEKALIRKSQRRASFEDIISYTKKEGAMLLISGDLFDSPSPSKATVSFCASQFERLGNIPVFIALGNHDYGICENLFPGNVHIFPEEFTTYSFENITVTGASFSKATQYFAPSIPRPKDTSKINILSLHGDILTQSTYNPMDKEFLHALGYDYIALGHIHSYYKDKNILYPGCHDGSGFDETGTKGFIACDIDKNISRVEFIPSSSAVYEHIKLDISSFNSSYEIVSHLGDLSPSGIYKLTLTGTVSPEFVPNIDYIQAALSENVFYIKVEDGTTIDKDITDSKIVSLFSDYISSCDEEIASLAYRYGIRALKGDEFDL